ncbi:MAG: glycosyltransferase family 4 protein [Chloroflexi bacterium]|nr:glycosyltransferase family 4 protein [Chloroflexota bacterium]
MKVCVGSPGRFHTFDLARQLARAGVLQRLYTGYPRWKVDGLSPERVSTFPWLTVAAHGAGRLGFHSIQRSLNWPLIRTFDSWLSSRLEPCDVFHCLSSFGVASHRVAKARHGALTICDRGSSHIRFQDDILREEYFKLDMPYHPIDPRVIERELTEYEECDVIFVPSRFVQRSFIDRGIAEEKLRVVPYGVDLEMFRPARKDDKVFRIVYVGEISVRKGIHYLLEAASRFPEKEVEVWLIGAASPEAWALLKRYEGRFHHFGVLPRAELYRYYSQGSVFVIASIEEGLALVQAQAMACGLPVIATTNTGAEDLFSDGVEGFIVPIRDADAIAERIAQLLSRPDDREMMAQAALKRVAAIGGWDSYGHKVLSAYASGLISRVAIGQRANRAMLPT